MDRENKVETPSATADKIAHTPGPWKAKDSRFGQFNILANGSSPNSLQVATVYETSVLKSDPDRLKADARLIAAAPELLEACKSAVAYFRANEIHPPLEIRAAIAKAEGTKND